MVQKKGGNPVMFKPIRKIWRRLLKTKDEQLTFSLIWQLMKRGWRIYLKQPKESKIFLDLSQLPIATKKIASTSTREEPKQVSVHEGKKLALVSCMKGKTLQIFRFGGHFLVLEKELGFSEQCVEVEVVNNLCFVTTTNFERGDAESSHLHVVDLNLMERVSSVKTGGEWSKIIKVSPDGKTLFVSNWHSHNISVFDISDHKKPILKQKIKCGESPRGLAFVDSKTCLVAGFYSSKIHILKLDEKKQVWLKTSSSPDFDPIKYQGNMRDIIYRDGDLYAWVSNLGRNMLHKFDISTGEIVDSFSVGKNPNAIRFLSNRSNIIAVSCRGSNAVCFFDLELEKVVKKSEKTGGVPTGMAIVDGGGGILLTSFNNNSLEYHKLV